MLSCMEGSAHNVNTRISVSSFLDYTCSSPRGCMSIVREQRRMYLDPTGKASAFYGPFRAGLRRAVNSTDPREVIAGVVDKAHPVQLPHFRTLQQGFERWWSTSTVSGVSVPSALWSEQALNVTLARQSLLGLRYTSGVVEVVLPYLKEPELNRELASPTLRILERSMDDLIPGAEPMVLDVRRGRPLRLHSKTNRTHLDALITGEAAKYLAHWQAAVPA